MYPRLWLARQLLTDDGVIFISIGEDEQANLKLLMDDIYGENSYITDFIWEKTQHFGRQKINYYNNLDYILSYRKNINSLNKEILVEFQKSKFDDAPLFNKSNNKQTLIFPKYTVKFNISDGSYNFTTNSKYILNKEVIVNNGTNENELVLTFKSRWTQKTVLSEIKKVQIF